MSERQQKIRLGLFVVVSLALFGGLIMVFGGAPGWFKKTNKYTMIFSDAPGLTPGTPVRKSGVKVGEVESIDLNDITGQVKVGVRLESKFTPRTTDEPTVTRGLIVGDTAIDFIPKAAGKAVAGEPIPPGAVIQGVSPFNAKTLIEQATGVVPEALKSLAQVRKSLEAYEAIAPQAQATLKDIGELAKSAHDFIPELKRTNDGLRDIFSSSGDIGPALKTLVPDLKKTNDEVRYFLKTASFWVEEAGVSFKRHEPRLVKTIDTLATTTERIGEVFNPENQKSIAQMLKSLDRLSMGADDLMKDGKTTLKTLNSTLVQAEQAITELRQTTRPIAERVPRILQNIENSSEQMSKAMVEARDLIRAVGQAEGSFLKFITDPTLYNNLNNTTAMLNRLMPQIDSILKDVGVFADKIARHPESLGMRGAIRPDSGLKEAPPSNVYKPKP